MGGVLRYLFVFVIIAFILFFFFKYMKETKIYKSKRWRKHVRGLFLLIASSIIITALSTGVYVYFTEGIH